MRWFTRPYVWLAAGLLILTVVGAILLANPACTNVEQEFLDVYWVRHYWQATFDALSAVAGVGVLTYDFNLDYTPRGRWTLTALGVCGAILYLLAATRAFGRRVTADVERSPPAAVAVIGFAAFLVVLIPVFWLMQRAVGTELTFSDAAWQTSAAFASLGWTRDPQAGLDAWPVALVAWIGALGWMAWVVFVPVLRRRCVSLRRVCVSVVAYVCFLAAAAGLISALEGPRGGPMARAQPAPRPYTRALVQAVAASGAGIPTETLSDRGVREGTKMTLAIVLLVGGMNGSAGGGVMWPLLFATVVGALSARERDATRAAAGCLLLMLALVAVVAFGLLLIENHVASPYQPEPTFADAFLDAASAVGGGNLSSGLTETVTGRNLIGGMRQGADLYQVGMGWLMSAMLLGRLLPIWLLWRMGDMGTDRHVKRA